MAHRASAGAGFEQSPEECVAPPHVPSSGLGVVRQETLDAVVRLVVDDRLVLPLVDLAPVLHPTPTQTSRTVLRIGEGYHVVSNRAQGLYVVDVDADHWKSWIHHRLSAPLDESSAMTLYQTAGHEHLSLAKHLTAETKTEEFVAGKGVVVRWERVRRNNHWFDALYNAAAAGHLAGVRMLPVEAPPRRPRVGVNSWFGDQRRAPFDTERWRDMQRRWNS